MTQKPQGSIGEWKISSAVTSRENRSYWGIFAPKDGIRFYRETKTITYEIRIHMETNGGTCQVCDPGDHEGSAGWACESSEVSASYSEPYGTYREVWVWRDTKWNKYTDDPEIDGQ